MEIRFELGVFVMLTLCSSMVLGNPAPQNVQRTNRTDDSLIRAGSSTLRSSRNPNRKPVITYTRPILQECGDTFCTNDPNYPIDVIASLSSELRKYEYLFGEDFEDTIVPRFDADEEGLCHSRRRLIYPQRGQTKHNTWLTIVNDGEKYKQGIQIEECRDAHRPCEYSQSFPLGVESKCKQHYTYRNLLAINAEGKPVMEHFQFPSCCKCMVTSSRSYNRFGGNENSDNERNDRLIFE